jgi:hypothetical protein
MSTEHFTDEEAITEQPLRDTLLKSAVLSKGRALGGLNVRPMTAETLSYLFEIQNFFIRGMKNERVAPQNANAVWSTAEFIYIHSADQDEVARVVWDRAAFKEAVRAYLAGPMNSPKMLTGALPIIEEMVNEYFASQSEPAASNSPANVIKRAGKASARVGKRATSR